VCRAATCRRCGLPTWKGCGAHVEQVLRSIPPAERCPGHGHETTKVKRKSWFSR
jgi:hypothetical protein